MPAPKRPFSPSRNGRRPRRSASGWATSGRLASCRSPPCTWGCASTGSSSAPTRRAGCSRGEPQMPDGVLYVVATPIGNLEDVTLRALRVLREVDLIAAEDTRRTRILLTRHGIERPLTSYYDAVERRRAPVIVERLKAGASVALVSEAVIAREHATRDEEVLRGARARLAERSDRVDRLRGEVTVVIAGAPPGAHQVDDGTLDDRIRAARAAGQSAARIAAALARETGRPRRELYPRAVGLPRDERQSRGRGEALSHARPTAPDSCP